MPANIYRDIRVDYNNPITEFSYTKTDVISAIIHCLDEIPKESFFHDNINLELCRFAKKFGLEGWIEVFIPDVNPKGKSGRIDVLWVRNNRPVVAIELDRTRYSASIRKLVKSNAMYKIWIYCGGRDDYNKKLELYDPSNQINTIKYHRKLRHPYKNGLYMKSYRELILDNCFYIDK